MSLVIQPPDQLTIVDRKYCGYHDGFARATEGSFVLRGKVKCWICNKCSELRAQATHSRLKGVTK